MGHASFKGRERQAYNSQRVEDAADRVNVCSIYISTT